MEAEFEVEEEEKGILPVYFWINKGENERLLKSLWNHETTFNMSRCESEGSSLLRQREEEKSER